MRPGNSTDSRDPLPFPGSKRTVCPPLGAGARILILSLDDILVDILRWSLPAIFASVALTVATTAGQVDTALANGEIDFLISDVIAADGDATGHLSRWTDRSVRKKASFRTWVATRHTEPAMLQVLQKMPLCGVYDPGSGTLDAWVGACTQVVNGGEYWSANVMAALAAARFGSQSVFHTLSNRDRTILGVIGDGCEDRAAAERLGVKVATVKSARRRLYAKIGVPHRGALVHRSAELGFVIWTPHGVLRPGLPADIAMRCRADDLRNDRRSTRTVA